MSLLSGSIVQYRLVLFGDFVYSRRTEHSSARNTSLSVPMKKAPAGPIANDDGMADTTSLYQRSVPFGFSA